MRISVISDDLTGASDCGGQLIRYGFDVSVILEPQADGLRSKDAVIIDTDSRSVTAEEAYRRVKEACESLQSEPFDIIYKKIDSTMRGNIGQEINAVYDVFRPDFVIIAPGFPQNGRIVEKGIMYLDGKPLHETEVARDPKTPVRDSLITRLIQEQAGREVGLLSRDDLLETSEVMASKLAAMQAQGIIYVAADSTEPSDLERLVRQMKQTGKSIIWVGSAGLMNVLPLAYGFDSESKRVTIPAHGTPVLLVVGSVSAIGRKQLQKLLIEPDMAGIEIRSQEIIQKGAPKQMEWSRVLLEAKSAVKAGRHIVLYSSNEVSQTQQLGQELGFSLVEISNRISQVLGEWAVMLTEQFDLRNLFLTGGDTARQVFQQLKVDEFHLLDEVEPGIPLGIVRKPGKDIYAVTKAGNFGSPSAMIKAARKLQGGEL
ncbi:four-carbon acid sugar kinase family protein [Paenibacillus sp. UNC451MF]|uniref:four-carbon acid sugar kinase family protein n=1 Tax=Paenibacillus sp. UNC451MF TaxID=1449063 RepID=UPI00048D90F1|nr:four-carbon acid sugar kinase family protein [Paenibacillus sp. UNC451MF]